MSYDDKIDINILLGRIIDAHQSENCEHHVIPECVDSIKRILKVGDRR